MKTLGRFLDLVNKEPALLLLWYPIAFVLSLGVNYVIIHVWPP